MRSALDDAAATAAALAGVQMHGTGTPLGDPIEIGALRGVVKARCSAVIFCHHQERMGSVKACDNRTSPQRWCIVQRYPRMPRRHAGCFRRRDAAGPCGWQPSSRAWATRRPAPACWARCRPSGASRAGQRTRCSTCAQSMRTWPASSAPRALQHRHALRARPAPHRRAARRTATASASAPSLSRHDSLLEPGTAAAILTAFSGCQTDLHADAVFGPRCLVKLASHAHRSATFPEQPVRQTSSWLQRLLFTEWPCADDRAQMHTRCSRPEALNRIRSLRMRPCGSIGGSGTRQLPTPCCAPC